VRMPPRGRGVPCSGKSSPRRPLLAIHAALMSALAGFGLVYPTLHMEAGSLVYPSCIALTLMFVWILWSWFLLRGTIFEPYSLFMITAGLFNGGQALLEVFGLNTAGILNGRFSSEILVQALYLVTISMAFLHGGALLALGRKQVREYGFELAGPSRLRALRVTGSIFLAISFVPTLILLKQSVSVVLDSGYFGLYQGVQSSSLNQVLAAFFIPGVIFLLAGSRISRTTQAICFVVGVLYAIPFLFMGARAAAAMNTVTLMWTWDRTIRRIPRGAIIGFALVSLILFSLIREIRNTAGRDRSLTNTYEAMTNLENPISAAVAEMGGSLITVAYTLDLVPASRDFDYGVSYLYALSNIVPNLGWSVHPSVAHGTLSDWLVKTVAPETAAAGGGLGYSFLAEAYLNFGWFGAPLWMGIFGYIIARVFIMADSGDPAKQALVASFLSFFLILPRGESAIVGRAFFWYALIPYLLAVVHTKVRGRRITTVTFTCAGGAIPVVQQRQSQRS
jgi:oligosaccharide repeat unit polymerase